MVLKYISVNNNVTAVEPNHSAWQPVWKFVSSVQQGIWSIYIKTAEVICSKVPMRQHEGHKMVFRYRKHSSPWFCSRTHWKGGKAFSCQQLSSALQKCNWWSPSISSWAAIHAKAATSHLHNQAMWQQPWDAWWQETAWSPQGVVCLTTSFRGVPKPFVLYISEPGSSSLLGLVAMKPAWPLTFSTGRQVPIKGHY